MIFLHIVGGVRRGSPKNRKERLRSHFRRASSVARRRNKKIVWLRKRRVRGLRSKKDAVIIKC